MSLDLAGVVRKRREQLGWTQTDLARAMGSSPSRVCKLEASDPSVASSLMLRALEIMNTPLRLEIDRAQDAFSDPELGDSQRRHLSARLLRRRRAERIAEKHAVDAGDVEHVLFNVTLPPWERLRRSFQRGRLRRIAPK